MKNKNILIIGGSTGIGFNIAKYCYESGSNLLISSGSNKIFSVCKKIKLTKEHKYKNTIDYLKINFKKKIDFKFFKTKIRNNFNNKINCVILNSAILGSSSLIGDLDTDKTRELFEINFFSHLSICNFLLKNKLLQKNSRIIFISGGVPNDDSYFIPYSSSKFSLYSLAINLASQLLKDKIFVNSILPGGIHTNINIDKINRGPKLIGKLNHKLALQRMKENNDLKYNNINRLITFLISTNSNNITGRLFSAQHDDWEKNINTLKKQSSNLFKINRIH